MRSLSQLENNVVSAIKGFSAIKTWEFSAAIKNKEMLLYFGTQMIKDASELPCHVNEMAKNGVEITVHHNHLSNESLSWADWHGLAEIGYYETFAHAANGIIYWGQVINKDAVMNCYSNRTTIDNALQRVLPSVIVDRGFGRAYEDWANSFFEKHVLAESLKAKGYVNYDVDWTNSPACGFKFPNIAFASVVSNIQTSIP
ncbi:MAG: hypothetical protein PHY92_08880 [Alphaproteobacteria bacterium]|nr:hypothetical protein [Alphaproteobacteria bacterium]